MFIAILPIRIDENSFWLSDTGMSCMDAYLKMFGDIPYIDQIFLISQEFEARNLADKYGMPVLKSEIPGDIDRPYTFEQIMALAQNFERVCPNLTADLIVADHRNVLLSQDDLTKAMSIYKENPHSGVISLAFCRDHPCQYRAYYTFWGCELFHFKVANRGNRHSENQKLHLSRIINTPSEDLDDISVTVHLQNTICRIAFKGKAPIYRGLVAHILPFTTSGPLYESFCELYVMDADFKILPGVAADQLEGLIVTVVMADHSGNYDAIECFTPKNADWELGVSSSVVIDKEKHIPIQGRQQFSPTYTFDGSICIINTKWLNQRRKPELVPVVVKDSVIVTDWIDYCNSIK